MYRGGDADRDADRDSGTERVTVQEAATRLRVGEQAIRKRVKRGTIDFDKEPDGRVYVYLPRHGTERSEGGDSPGYSSRYDPGYGSGYGPADASESEPHPAYRELLDEKDARIEDLRAQLAAEREANRENRRIIAGMVQRVPELEASERREEAPDETQGPREAGEGSAPTEHGAEAQGTEEAPRRSWWRRIFGS